MIAKILAIVFIVGMIGFVILTAHHLHKGHIEDREIEKIVLEAAAVALKTERDDIEDKLRPVIEKRQLWNNDGNYIHYFPNELEQESARILNLIHTINIYRFKMGYIK